jgi:two-component system OmpR family sensor kinase
MIMGLLVVALTATGGVTLTLLHSYLQDQVDDKLYAAVALAAKQQSFSQLQAPTNPIIPTDYSLILYRDQQEPYPFGGDKQNHPDIANMSVAQAESQGRVPFQVRGTDGENWRVVAVSVLSNDEPAVVVIGLPLQNVDDVVKHANLVVAGVGLLTLLLASLIGSWTVSRSFRPLARVEKTAAAIAAGDLSRRVDVDNPHTELGRLGSSLNAMLAHIETAFAARTASEDAPVRRRRLARTADPAGDYPRLLRALPARRPGHRRRRCHRHGQDRKRSQAHGLHGGGPPAAGPP